MPRAVPPRGSPRSPAGPSGTPSQVATGGTSARLPAQRLEHLVRRSRAADPAQPARRLVVLAPAARSSRGTPRSAAAPPPRRRPPAPAAPPPDGRRSGARPAAPAPPGCRPACTPGTRAVPAAAGPARPRSPAGTAPSSIPCPRPASRASSASACGTVRGNPSSTNPPPVSGRAIRSLISAIMTRSSTSRPASICRRASSPSGVACATASRRISPVEISGQPPAAASRRPWVPFPVPGAPSMTTRNATSSDGRGSGRP